MAWWQRKILRYALSRTGLLNNEALNLDNLDITLGKTNVVELKDVDLNIRRISTLIQLPSSLRIETARVLSLRLTVPADIYQSSIVAEVDGVELSLKLDEGRAEAGSKEKARRARYTATTHIPQHRKVHRRIRTPPPFDPGGLSNREDAHIPTAEELAKSFLLEEPAQERRALEASVAAGDRALEESIASLSSDGNDLGTGAAMGLPGFLASFLQGIVDRLQIHVKNVEARLETEVPGDGDEAAPVTLRLHVGSLELASVGSSHGSERPGNTRNVGGRQIRLLDMSLDLISDAGIFAELSQLSSPASPAESRQRDQSPATTRSGRSDPSLPPVEESAKLSAHQSIASIARGTRPLSSSDDPDAMQASILTADADRFADAADDERLRERVPGHPELEIQPGDDNISWGSRRSQSDGPVEDLWNSMVSEDDLPDSLVLDRTLPPFSHSSRNASPTLSRQRQDLSPPHQHNRQSPGSWPNLEESPDSHRSIRSPGSWPVFEDAGTRSLHLSRQDDDNSREFGVDNKLSALESTNADFEDPIIPLDTPTEAADDDLATSRFFTHEEAESMYLSAMSHSDRMHIPGGWGSEDAQSDRSSSPKALRLPPANRSAPSKAPAPIVEDNSANEEQQYSTPGNVTPRAPSPAPQKPPELPAIEVSKKSSKRIVAIDFVSLWIPTEQHAEDETGDDATAFTTASVIRSHNQLPGSFSAYSERSASQRHSAALRKQESSGISSQRIPQTAEQAPSISIEVGSIKCQLDMPCGRLLLRLSSQATAVLGSVSPQDPSKNTENAERTRDFSISISDIKIVFKEGATSSLDDSSLFVPRNNLASLECRQVNMLSRMTATEIRCGKFAAFLGPSCLLSFSRQPDLASSMIISEQTPDIALSFTNRKLPYQRPVTEIAVETIPVNVIFDLPVVDETFEALGGLSGVFEIGSSILSESAVASPTLSPTRPSKGVRFEGESEIEPTGTEYKVNARIGNVSATLKGNSCSINLQTTTVKAGYREQGAGITVEQISLTGPCGSSDAGHPPMSINFSTLRLDYLFTPQTKDLEKLLSLITPSKDKFDDDDDILIDTLLNQRRKGAVARIAAANVNVQIHDWKMTESLTALANELGKLSAVTKYLPEDERPGLLTLIRIKDINCQLPVTERFGNVDLRISDLHCAHIGLPALLAFSIVDVNVGHTGYGDLLHSLVQSSASENLPMIMGRVLGDEIEPTLKLKLFNTCVEYQVPVIVALTSLDETSNGQEFIAELAQSVADLTQHTHLTGLRDAGAASDTSNSSSKRMKIDVQVHDSAIGLTPERLCSKALFVLTDARVSVHIPAEHISETQIELRRAGLFVTDRVIPEDVETTVTVRSSPNNTATKPKLTTTLGKRGFVSVSSIMAAKILICVDQTPGEDVRTDVELRNELLLLETCADSTQTLIATLSGLSPPAPPSKQPKYLTEPMTIEDMMASFTGEAFQKPVGPPETLFDVEEDESEDDRQLSLDIPTLGEVDDDLLMESEMTSSLYGPISGILGGADESEDADDPEDFPETAESLLEDDPFEMPTSHAEMRLSDSALARELNKQCKWTASPESVDLGLYEIEDLGFDAVGGNLNVLGTQHRFNTPAVGRKERLARKEATRRVPFRLKVRDLHIIWNIYDGYDWQQTREGITQAVEQVELLAEERKAKRRQSSNEREDDESVIGDFLFNSIYIGVPSSHDAQELRRQINRDIDDFASETESAPMSGMSKPTTVYSASGRPVRPRQRKRLKLERSRAHKVAFELKGVSADILVFGPEDPETVSAVDVRVRDFEIFDNVPTSTWRKFLTHLSNEPGDREMSKPMVHLELSTVRTLEKFAASELVIHVSLLPLRLHVDQDALDFITRFFEFKDGSTDASSEGSEEPFIQRLEVDTVDLQLDYKPKKVDYAGIRSGHTTEFMNFIILDAANIRLNHAIVYGIQGFEPLHKTLNDIWMPDVKRNQLPTVLAGLAPVRSLVNIGSGVRDVIAIPIREYKKDGRIVRSIQKGAYQFGKTTASELARLGAKVALGTHTLLQDAEGLLSPGSASAGRPSPIRNRSSDQAWHDIGDDEDEHEHRAISAYANQPLGVLSGLRAAQRHLEYDLLTAKDALIAVQGEVMESGGASSAVAAVARHAPTIILRPFMGGSRAVGAALLGVGNQIDRANLRRVEDKYKRR